MKFQVSDGEKFQKVMEVTISAEEMTQYMRIGCKKLADKVNIPGFRKGKAPRSILENFVGIQAILDEAADAAMPKAYVEGLQETGLEPVAQPDIDIVQLEDGKDMIFKAIITVKPEIQLGEYKGIEVTRRVIDVADEDVTEELDRQQKRMAKLVEGDEDAEAAKGDTVVIDFKGIMDGVAFDGGSATDYPLELGSGAFIPGFEEQLIGAKKGDKRDLDITFPEDYTAKELAGKAVVFEVEVKAVKHKEIPELNDDFAQEVSETANNMEELKAEIKAKLADQSLAMSTDSAISNCVAAAVDKCTVEIPPVMIEYEMDHLVEDNKRQMEASQISLKDYLDYTKQTEEQFREQFREQAEFSIRKELMIEAIIAKENIQIPQEDIDQHISDMAARYWMTEEQLKEALEQGSRMEDFIYDMKRAKASRFIFDNAKLTDEHITKEELKRRAEEQAKERAAKAEELMHKEEENTEEKAEEAEKDGE